MALGIISNISDRVQVDKLSKYINTSVIWILGIVLTLFVGVSSLEGSITNGVDALTVKTTKAAVSNFIPIVGKILRRCGRNGNGMQQYFKKCSWNSRSDNYNKYMYNSNYKACYFNGCVLSWSCYMSAKKKKKNC